ncbi:hypothetical protein Tco_1204734 [Tanacetum coccineum]
MIPQSSNVCPEFSHISLAPLQPRFSPHLSYAQQGLNSPAPKDLQLLCHRLPPPSPTLQISLLIPSCAIPSITVTHLGGASSPATSNRRSSVIVKEIERRRHAQPLLYSERTDYAAPRTRLPNSDSHAHPACTLRAKSAQPLQTAMSTTEEAYILGIRVNNRLEIHSHLVLCAPTSDM